MNELPSGWSRAALPELVASDGVFSDGDWVESKDQDPSGDVRLIQLADVGDGYYRNRSARFLTLAKAHQLGCTFLKNGDVLIARMPDPLGRACCYPGDAKRAVTVVDVCIIRPGMRSVNPRWLMYTINAPQSRSAMAAYEKGTTRRRISRGNLARIPLPIPPLAEQERIVAAIEEQFSRLDAGVAALERVRQNIKRMRAAIFESAVTEWIGEGFPQTRLGDVLREPLRNGHSAKADSLGTIPVLTLTAVTLDDFGTHNIKMTAANPQRVRDLWIQPGDLLIERSNTRELVGTACLYRGRPNLAVYPDLVIRARVDDRVVPEYAELVLKAPRSRRYFQQRAQGISGTMPKIDQQAIEDLVFTLPSPEMQAAIVQEAERRLTLLGSLQGSLELAAKRSSSLQSSILTAAFSGQLASQDPKDEPASVLLERIAAERTASNGHKPTRTRKPRAPGERITA